MTLMKSGTHAALLLVALMATLTVNACAGGKPIDVDQDDDDDAATLTTSLNLLITGPWNNEGCNSLPGCHQGAAPAGQVLLGGAGVTTTDVFTSIHTRPLVLNTATPASSVLLTDPAGVTTHTGGTVWTTADPSYQGTLIWIQQGAQNN